MEIDCPETCPYLKRHEAFQREKHAARYRKVWTEVNADIAQDRDTLQHVFFLERMLLAVSARVPGITDEQVATSLSDLRARLSPIELIAQPGTPLLTVTRLDEVTLTAYVPERSLGLVKLGQEVQVSVDSYPDEYFTGTVVYISPNALFTPKNIQLKEEREKMVFAVKISLPNPEQKLKPGMPADARILTGVEGK